MSLHPNRLLSVQSFAAMFLIAVNLEAGWERTYSWQATERITGIVAARATPRVYAHHGSIRLLISDDAGRTWRTSTGSAPGAITAVAIDPNRSEHVIVGTAGDAIGLYETTDARIFTPLGDGIFRGTFGLIEFDPFSSTTVFATRTPTCLTNVCISPGGIMKSIDGGKTWEVTGREDSTTRALVIDPRDSQVLYASGFDLPTLQTGGIYRTTDGGATWPALFPGSTSIRALAVDNNSRVYALVEVQAQNHVLRSSDRGTSWTRLVTPLNILVTHVAVHPYRSATIVIASRQGIMLSLDDGATWQTTDALPDRDVLSLTLTNDSILVAGATGIYRHDLPAPPPARRRTVRK